MVKQEQQGQAKVQAQATLPIRVVSVQELVARAYALYLNLRREGKTTRRVVLSLRPNELPPDLPNGEIECAFGKVVVKTAFVPEKGRWFITVKFQFDFTVRDHLKEPPQSQ